MMSLSEPLANLDFSNAGDTFSKIPGQEMAVKLCQFNASHRNNLVSLLDVLSKKFKLFVIGFLKANSQA
jgi:hypothetical protein